MAIVIIEGPDRCGKSTLIQQLRNLNFNAPGTVVHHSIAPPPVPDPNFWEIENYRLLLENATTTYDHLAPDHIFDRFHLGAYVYGVKYRSMRKDVIQEIERGLLGEDDIYLILLTDDVDQIISRDDGLSQEKDRDDLINTIQAFDEAFSMSMIKRKIRINISQNGGFANTYPLVADFIFSKGKTC